MERERKKKMTIIQQIEIDQREDEDDPKEDQQDEENEKEFHMGYVWSLIKYNQKYWYLHLFGILGSMYIGAVFPIFAYLLSQIIDVLSTIESTPKNDIAALSLQQK